MYVPVGYFFVFYELKKIIIYIKSLGFKRDFLDTMGCILSF